MYVYIPVLRRKTMKYNIAQIGTFDCENFGDLMFPIICKTQLEKRIDIKNFFLFSPNACNMPLNPQKTTVYSIDDLEAIHKQYGLDAIILGGGDLARLDNLFVPDDRYATNLTSFKLMIYPAIVANKYNIPFIWNCPGVPFEFSDNSAILLKEYFDSVDYISVRDNCSKKFLAKIYDESKITTSPDTVLSVSSLIDKNQDGIFDNLKSEFDFLSDNYFVFQTHLFNHPAKEKRIIEQLKSISENYAKKVVFLPIGNVHNDDVFLNELLEKYPCDNFCSFSRKLSIFEIASVLANSSAFIGTSLHGNIVSNSYGVPSIGINLFDFVKLKNYFKLIGRENFIISDIDKLRGAFDNLIDNPLLEGINNAFNNVAEHFDKICKLISSKEHVQPDIIPLLTSLCQFNPNQTIVSKPFSEIYFDYGEGFSSDKKITIPYEETNNHFSFTLDLKDSVKSLRVDPIDNSRCIVNDIKISCNNKNNVQIFTPNGIYYKSINLAIFNNTDPQIIINIDSDVRQITIDFDVLPIDSSTTNMLEIMCDNIGALIDQRKAKEKKAKDSEKEAKEYKFKFESAQKRIDDYAIMVQSLNSSLAAANNSFFEIQQSFFWRITSPLRKILQKAKNFSSHHTRFLEVCIYAKGFLQGGFKGGKEKLSNYHLFIGRKPLSKNNWSIDQRTQKKQTNFRFSKNIKFSIVVPLYNTPKDFLEQMINSVRNQTYRNWELCLADGSDDKHSYVKKYCINATKRDKRIKYIKLTENKGISENTNVCLEMATGDYIGLFDHDDILHPSVLYRYMHAICEKDADFIYCDEDKFNTFGGVLFDAHFKPNFAIDNLRANNYICHFSVFKKSLLDQVGYFRKEFDGSQDHDLILRLTEKAKKIIHIPQILYHWRVSEASVASDPYAKSYAIEAGIKAVSEHLDRVGIKGTVESTKIHPNIYRIRYDIIGNPLISILIPNYNHVDDLSRCINSILEKTTYNNYEIIIIENNSNKETFEYYETLKKYENIKVVIYKPQGSFNYSAINNYGAQFAKGEHYILLNNDVEIITPEWIEEMLMYSQRKDVGAVGAMLYYPNNTIQHAGIAIGVLTLAGHSFKHQPRGATGYFGRAGFSNNVSAVTFACVMMRSDVFNEVGGLDEKFKVAFNDVDMCMRIRKKGYLITFTPFAELYHYESISRGLEDTEEKQERFRSEVERFQKRWKKELEKGDPYYNPNLTLEREDFSAR